MKILTSLLAAVILSGITLTSHAQDTLEVNLETFIQLAIENSGQAKFNNSDIDLAENRVQQAKAQRFLPQLQFRSEHAAVPGVKSFGNFPENELYLDPTARNDWDNWGLFTRVRISAAQPIINWGAVKKAVRAAENGVRAAEEMNVARQNEIEVQMFELYYSYILALEIERLLAEATDNLNQIEESLQEAYDNGDDGIDDTELFRLEVFKAEFDIQKAEVIEGLLFVKRAWAYVLRNDQNIVYVPNTVFLDPLAKNLEDVSYYQTSALQYRPEIRSIGFTQAGISNFIASLEAQARPQLILGMSTTFASTPIRPRQRNPFIVNQGNTFNTGLGFTIRQNLNFMQIRPNIERSKIELRRIDFLKMSAQDGIMLEVTDAYRQAKLSEVRVEKTDDALVKTKEWLRQEQLDIDFGIGDTRDFVDALQKELELKLALKEVVFEYNMNLAELNRTAGFSVTSLID